MRLAFPTVGRIVGIHQDQSPAKLLSKTSPLHRPARTSAQTKVQVREGRAVLSGMAASQKFSHGGQKPDPPKITPKSIEVVGTPSQL